MDCILPHEGMIEAISALLMRDVDYERLISILPVGLNSSEVVYIFYINKMSQVFRYISTAAVTYFIAAFGSHRYNVIVKA
jgi:hypothetical protein